MTRTCSNANPYKSRSSMSKNVCEDEGVATRFFCPICSDSVGRKSDLERHMRVHTGEGFVYCTWPGCTHVRGFSQESNLEQHVKAVHLGIRVRCPHFWADASGNLYACAHTYSDPSNLIRHRSIMHGFEAGDDEAEIRVPTLVGTVYPGSTYAHTRKNSARHAPKMRLLVIARPTPMLATPPTPPVQTAKQEESDCDCDSLYTIEAAEPSGSKAGPPVVQVTVPNSDPPGRGVTSTPPTGPFLTQPPLLFAGANLACPLMAPLDAPVVVPREASSPFSVTARPVIQARQALNPNPEPQAHWQTADVHEWTLSSPITELLHSTFPIAGAPNRNTLVFPGPGICASSTRRVEHWARGLAIDDVGLAPALGMGRWDAGGWESESESLSDRDSDSEWMVQKMFMAIAPREALREHYGSV
ncbi:hypothetical protein V8D89_002545 [Ganoderma adspersum]